MSQIIKLEDRRRKVAQADIGSAVIVVKSIDGQRIECINVDALTAVERRKFLSKK
jgi:hypothetical protein